MSVGTFGCITNHENPLNLNQPSATRSRATSQLQPQALQQNNLYIQRIRKYTHQITRLSTMGLKRKRSSDYGCSSPSTSSTLSISSHASSNPFSNPLRLHPVAQMELDFPAIKPSSWGFNKNDSGRTRKRWRDGRPDERQIHRTRFHITRRDAGN